MEVVVPVPYRLLPVSLLFSERQFTCVCCYFSFHPSCWPQTALTIVSYWLTLLPFLPTRWVSTADIVGVVAPSSISIGLLRRVACFACLSESVLRIILKGYVVCACFVVAVEMYAFQVLWPHPTELLCLVGCVRRRVQPLLANKTMVSHMNKRGKVIVMLGVNDEETMALSMSK